MEAKLREPAAAPDPVARDGIHNQADGCRVKAVRLKVGALGHGARNNGGRRGAEHRLKERIYPGRKATKVVGALNERVDGTNERTCPAKHNAKAHNPIARRADAEVHQVLHQNIAGILGACEASLAQREARLHEVDQKRSHERPGHVCRTEHILSSLCRWKMREGVLSALGYRSLNRVPCVFVRPSSTT